MHSSGSVDVSSLTRRNSTNWPDSSRPPAERGLRDPRPRGRAPATMTTAVLLERLEHVRQTGAHQWRARCPSCGGKSQKISIRELDDGRVLLHDFGGCDVHEVLGAVGLTVGDLFPEQTHDYRPATKSSLPAREALALVDHEVIVATLIVGDILKDRKADADQWQRLALAANRIGQARDMSCPARVPKEQQRGQ
jgi:hypothetical protein